MYSNAIERNKSNLPWVGSGYQIGSLLAVPVFTFFIFNPQEPISKFSGSLFDTDDSMRDQRNTRTALQEKHKSAIKGKTLAGSNTKVQPPVSAASSFPGKSGWIPEELRAVDVPQPPLKVLNCCMGWACRWRGSTCSWGSLRVHREVCMSMGKTASCGKQFIKDAKKGGHCMVDVMRLTFPECKLRFVLAPSSFYGKIVFH